MKSKLSTAKKSKTTTFSRVFHLKKSTIFTGNQSWFFGQEMKIWNSVCALLFSLENQMVGRVLCFSHLMCLVWEWRQKSRESRHAVYPCFGNISWVTFKVLLERLQNLERFWHHFERTNKVIAAGVINSKWLNLKGNLMGQSKQKNSTFFLDDIQCPSRLS